MRFTAKQLLVHITLFVVTLVTTTLAGAEWTYGRSLFLPGFTWSDVWSGLPYSISFLAILTAHEFGHYFMAVYHRVKTTLPYYLPLPPMPLMLGTLGAVIRLKSHNISKKHHFDIGLAGPLAGFVLALGILCYGFTHLPPPEYIFEFHPEYKSYGVQYADHVYSDEYLSRTKSVDIVLGKNIAYMLLEKWVGTEGRVPNMHEVMHYPYLFAGLLALLFTSINLLPIGQLDGGHVLYGLLGSKGHQRVASVVFVLFLFYAGLGYMDFNEATDALLWKSTLFIGFLYLCLTGLKRSWRITLIYALSIFLAYYLIDMFFSIKGYSGWLLFALIIGWFIGVRHPVAHIEPPLDMRRQLLGWLALAIFLICFIPNPIEIRTYQPDTHTLKGVSLLQQVQRDKRGF